jgi:epoxyqueuosine reductase
MIDAGTSSEHSTRAGLLKAQAYGLGFDLAGIVRLGPTESSDVFERWLARGHAGDMEYLARGAEKRRDTRLPFAGAVSAVVVAMNYGGSEPSGPVARYARGDDYHDLIVAKLRTLHAWLAEREAREIAGKAYVDTGPILERDLARRAGLGWFGKNTNLINPGLGSYFFLGALFLAIDLEPDTPFATDHCGTCRRCIDACPTGAIVAERELDATRCISYLTIEHRGAIPVELRAGMGELVYGCDICQEVCPWNQKFSRALSEPAFSSRPALAGRNSRSLATALLGMSQAEFSAGFKRSPMKRARLRGLKRNSAVVLGNVGTAEDIAVLVAALDDPEPLVREHAAWALGRVGAADSLVPLQLRLAVEPAAAVQVEIRTAIARLGE